jgi:hypothetical protein
MRTKLISVSVAMLTVAALSACGDDGSDETTAQGTTATGQAKTAPESGTATTQAPKPETIVVRNAKPVGGVAELEYSAGDDVRFQVRSDVADEVHVHGYDVSKEVPAGGTITFSFTADIEGIFEVELEERGEQIAELRVNP